MRSSAKIQLFAALQSDAHLAHHLAHRLLAAGGEALGKVAKPVGEMLLSAGTSRSSTTVNRRILLQAGDDAAAGLVEFGPPGEVIVTKIEGIGGTPGNRHALAAVMSLTVAVLIEA